MRNMWMKYGHAHGSGISSILADEPDTIHDNSYRCSVKDKNTALEPCAYLALQPLTTTAITIFSQTSTQSWSGQVLAPPTPSENHCSLGTMANTTREVKTG